MTFMGISFLKSADMITQSIFVSKKVSYSGVFKTTVGIYSTEGRKKNLPYLFENVLLIKP
jgi:hypothetical protein